MQGMPAPDGASIACGLTSETHLHVPATLLGQAIAPAASVQLVAI